MSGPSLPPFLLPQAVAISFTGGIFLGLYLVSAAYANRWLIFTDEGWQFRKNIHWHILATTNLTLVLVLITQGLTVNTSIAEAAFVEQGHKLSGYKEPDWMPVVKCAISGIIVLLADTVLMHRLWITYMRRIAIMWFPIFLWFGGIACLAMQIFLQIKNIHDPNFGPYEWAKVNMDVGPGIVFLPFLASTITLNGYCTGLLIWRVWMSLKEGANGSGTRQLQILIRILMESGVLYLAMSISHFVSYFGTDNFAIHMMGTLHTVVIGIAFDLIIIRVGQNRTEDGSGLSTGKLTTFQVAHVNTTGSSIGYTNSGTTGVAVEYSRDKITSL